MGQPKGKQGKGETPLLEDIRFIVSGKPTEPDNYPPNQKLGPPSRQAIKETNNTGELDSWKLTLDGRTLDFDKTFEQENVPNEAELHLNPKKGKGGQEPRSR